MDEQGYTSVNALATEIEFPQKTLNDLMNGTSPRLETLQRLSAAIGIDQSELLGFEPRGLKEDLYEALAGALTEPQLKDVTMHVQNALRLGAFDDSFRLLATFLAIIGRRTKS